MDYLLSTCIPTAAENNIAEKNSFLDLPLEVVEYILPHLPPQTILALSLVSKAFYSLIFHPTGHNGRHSVRTWRYLNLGESYNTPPSRSKKPQQRLPGFPPSPPPSPPPGTSYRFIQNPESILLKPYVFENVRTLILDGLPSVDTWFVDRILGLGAGRIDLHRIEILSIRNCPNLDDKFLATTILNQPHLPLKTLKGIYYFSDPEMDFSPSARGGAEVFVSSKMARVLNTAKRRSPHVGGWWAMVITMLKEKVAFDIETCKGVAHFQLNPLTGEFEEDSPRVATMRLTKGCAGCGAHPEVEDHVAALKGNVLFPPAPIHTSNLAGAKCTRHLVGTGGVRVILRCSECLDKRYCRGCGKWWCQPCASKHGETYEKQGVQPVTPTKSLPRTQIVSLDCFECGALCSECTSLSSRECVNCKGCYCALHNEGSNPDYCEWCMVSKSHRRGSIGSVSRIAPGRRYEFYSLFDPIPASATPTPITTPTSTSSEIDTAISSAAVLSDPTIPYLPLSHLTTPPTSPHLAAVPQPVILLSSRLPPSSSLLSSINNSATSKLKGKGLSSPGVGGGTLTGPPASPILKAMSGKGEVHRSAGMRLRTMMEGGNIPGTGMGGSGSIGVGAGARRGGK